MIWKHYVVGFYFDSSSENVALIRKNRPAWQAGKLNGIGGKVEPGEGFHNAMVREFREETGVQVSDWEHVCSWAGGDYEVQFYRAYGDLSALRNTTDELIEIVSTSETRTDMIDNLRYLIPLAKYKKSEECAEFTS